MARFTGFDEVFSALYVNFDAVYSYLSAQSPETARVFATAPQHWIKWLEIHALRMLYGDGVRRRILKRTCYLNMQKHGEFRHYFVKSGFRVVNVAPLPNINKFTAGINFIMDCMDDLSAKNHFDEFIILAGDTDLTPLLIRLQEHARRTLVLAAGLSPSAYSAVASWRIREDWFIQQALKENSERSEQTDEEISPDAGIRRFCGISRDSAYSDKDTSLFYRSSTDSERG